MSHDKFNGMSLLDRKIFIGSLILGNVYRSPACYTGIPLVEWE
jgi:hypothetical protein